jgi:DNA sulfur modification protein DndD
VRINIAGWSCEGLRCPDVDIDLRKADGLPFHVAFLQMPNGTGKTTTLDLLKAALSGEAASWDEAMVRGVRRRGDENESGSFKVKLLVDGRPLTFEIDFDFENGRALCYTTRPGSGGVRSGWLPPPEMRRFLDISFLNLFVFNGELANKLFVPEEGAAEGAIDALCQLYLLENVSDQLDTEWNKAAKSRAGPKTQSTLESLQSKLGELQARKTKLTRNREKAVAEQAAAQAKSDELEEKIREKTAGMNKDQGDLADGRTREAKADATVKEATASLHQAMRLPLALSPFIGKALDDWKDQLDDLKLPEVTSAQFFTDLQKKDECICGTTMTEGMRIQIGVMSKAVLSTAENGQLNIIKGDIEKYRPEPGGPTFNEDLTQKLADLSAARREQLEAQQDVRALRRKIIEAGGDQVQEWEEQQKESDETCGRLQALIDAIDDAGLNLRPGEEVYSLAKIQRDIDEATAKITEATNTVELRRKTTLIQSILQRAEELARRTIKDELLIACNNRLKIILANDPIELEAIDGHLKLAGQDRGSEAQMLSVGYTFLMTLLERGDNRFPLLVDSPVGKMDGTVRRQVGRLIPDLCSQFVTFVINTERADFVSSVEGRATDALYLTFFRKTDGTRRLMANLPAGNYAENDSGVLVNDEVYFDSFDMEDEE